MAIERERSAKVSLFNTASIGCVGLAWLALALTFALTDGWLRTLDTFIFGLQCTAGLAGLAVLLGIVGLRTPQPGGVKLRAGLGIVLGSITLVPLLLVLAE